MLASYGRSELAAILDRNLGWDVQNWTDHMAGLDFPLNPVPKQVESPEL